VTFFIKAIMSIHIQAEKGEIAPVVLLPGDPLRAKFVADTYLEEVLCYNRVRGMYGFTGIHQGVRVSVQGSGMGMPSMAIYVNELIQSYDVRCIIRIGSCGALQEEVEVHDLVFAMTASTDSVMNLERFPLGFTYSPAPTYTLLERAIQAAREEQLRYHVGSVLSTDSFYHDNSDLWKQWARFGTLAVEMETYQLYTLAAKFNIETLSILTVSDSLLTRKELNSEERQIGLQNMFDVVFSIIRSNMKEKEYIPTNNE